MNFVTIEKNQKSAPHPNQIMQAMVNVGGTPINVEGTNAARTLFYTGEVNHTKYENALIGIVHDAKRNSWDFIWADAMEQALVTAEELGLRNSARNSMMLNAMLAATRKIVKIEISDGDLTGLKNSGYKLCFAKRVGNHEYNVVWQSYSNYLSNNTFSWTPQYELFGSNVFRDNISVQVATNTVQIGLGESSVLDSTGLLGNAYTAGPSTAITLRNQYGPIHPGVNQISFSSMGESISTPIYVAQDSVVKGDTLLTPVEQVLVWFEQNIETSTMFSTSRSNQVEIDLTSNNSATRRYIDGEWITPN
jgi:hypothetical protein